MSPLRGYQYDKELETGELARRASTPAGDTWFHIAFAPRDGTFVRIRDDEGYTYVSRFAEPHWWMLGLTPGRKGPAPARIADDVIYNGDLDIRRVVQFQPLP